VFAPLGDPPFDPEAIWARHPQKVELFRRWTLASPPFAPELDGFLKRMHAGHKLAVVTASARIEIEPLLAAGGIAGRFDALVCGKEAGRNKPAPDPYLRAAALLEAKNPLVVEDSEAGIASGRAAGFEVLVIDTAAGMMDAVMKRLAL
jgi:HAD superfamily hydrolase (TIGR01509 family)